MAKTRSSAYQTAQAKLQTAPRYLVRFTSREGDAFSRDFSTGTILSATKNPYPYLAGLDGNTQTLDLRNGTSTIGTFTLRLLDKGGLITAYCGNPQKGLKSAITTGTVTAIDADASVAGYPDQGTIELVSTANVRERIRYTSLDKPGQRFLGITRGVDGTTAQAWAAGSVLHNGEQIRPRTLVKLSAGYGDVAEADFLKLGTFEVLERSLAADRVTWVVTATDVQRVADTSVFLGASENSKVILGPEHPFLLALRVLQSTGTGANGTYDTLAEANGVGMPSTLVDVAGIVALKATVQPNVLFEFSISSPADALAWVQTQCFAPLGCVPFITEDGKLSVKQLLLAALASDSVATLTTANIMQIAWQAGDRGIVNAIDVDYDWDTDPVLPNAYARREQYRSGASTDPDSSIGKYGRKPTLRLTCQGVRTARDAISLLDSLATRTFRRFAEPGGLLQVDVQYRSAHHLEVGDIVTVTHPDVPNLSAGLRGLSSALMQVFDTRPVFGPNGRMVLTLGTVTQGGAPATDVFSRSGFALASLPALTAPENFTAAQLDQHVALTWKALAVGGTAGTGSGAIAYEIRKGSTWDAGIVITPDWAGVSYMVPNVLDDTHTYRIKAFRKDDAGVKTYGPESTIVLGTANNDVLRNFVIDRDEVALVFPGTRVGLLTLSEYPNTLLDLNGTWFDVLSTRWFDTAALSGFWFRTIGARQYTTPAIDQGKMGQAAVLLTLAVSALDAAGWYDSYPARWFDTYGTDWFSLLTADAAITIEIQLSDDNVVWGAWLTYQQGASYAFRYMKVRVTATPQSDTAWVKSTVFRLTIDVQDVTQQVRNYSVPAAVTTVTYASLTPAATYVVAPYLTPILKGGLVNKAIIINAITATQFDIAVRDKADALIAATVDLDIHGY